MQPLPPWPNHAEMNFEDWEPGKLLACPLKGHLPCLPPSGHSLSLSGFAGIVVVFFSAFPTASLYYLLWSMSYIFFPTAVWSHKA